MACYVDPLQPITRNFGKIRWGHSSHLVCDTHDELMAAAESLGLKPEWIQKAGHPQEHFDLSPRKREFAVLTGVAADSTIREVAEVWRAKRREEG